MVCPNWNNPTIKEWVDNLGKDAAYDEYIMTEGSPRPFEEVHPEFTPKVEKTQEQKVFEEMERLATDEKVLDVDKKLQEIRAQVTKQLSVFKKTLSEEDKHILDLFKKYLDDPKSIGSIRTYTEFVYSSERLLGEYAKRVRETAKESTPAIEKMVKLRYYYEFANSYDNMLKELGAALDDAGSDNPVKPLLKSMLASQDTIKRTYEAQALPIIADILSGTNVLSNEKFKKATEKELKEIEERIAHYTKLGNADRVLYFKKKQAALEKFLADKTPTKEVLLATLKGEKGDSSYLSFLFEATISNGDPIISSFAKFIKDKFNALRKRIIPIMNKMQGALDDFDKVAKRDRGNVSKYWEGMYEVVNRIEGDSDEPQKFYALVGEFDDSYILEQQKAYREIGKLRADGKVEEAQKRAKEFRDWERTHMEREYTDEYYAAYDLLTPDAAEKRRDIFAKIKEYDRRGYQGILLSSDLDELKSLWDDYKQLGYDKDKFGQMKGGEELATAKSIQAFNEARRKYIKYELIDKGRNLFDRLKKEKDAQLKAAIITKRQYDNWMRANTTREIAKEFFDKRGKVLSKINALYDSLRKTQAKEGVEDQEALKKRRESLKEMWETQFAIAISSRDEDGIPNGNLLTDEQLKTVRDTNQEIEDLMRSFVGDTGLSREERSELDKLWSRFKEVNTPEAIRKGEDMTKEEWARFESLRVRKKTAKENMAQYAGVYSQLRELFSELMEMQETNPTEYYYEVYEKRLQAFMQEKRKTNPDYNETAAKEDFKHEDEWYKNNHYSVLKWVDNGEEIQGKEINGKYFGTSKPKGKYEEVDTPTYAWVEVLPTNEKYILEGQPSFKYKSRTVLDSYKDDNGTVHQIKNPNYKQGIDGYNTPKKRVTIEGVEQDSPYLNKKWYAMKNSANDVDRAKFKLLGEVTQMYLGSQKDLGTRMGLRLPSIEKGFIDRIQDQQIDKEYVKSKAGSLIEGFKRMFSPNEQDIDEGIMTGLGDMQGHEFRYVPTKYTGNITADNQSLNIAESILRFCYSAEQTKTLNDAQPIAQSLIDVLKNNPVELDKIDAALKSMGIMQKLKKGTTSNREMQLQEFVNMIFFNEFQKDQEFLGISLTKLSNSVMKVGALQILALNIPSQVTNYISGYMQSYIESAAKNHFSAKQLTRALLEYKKLYPDMIRDSFKVGKKSLIGQLIDRFDVEQGKFESHLGSKADHSLFKELKHVPYILKNAGEHELAASIFIAKAMNTILDQKLKDGTIKKITLYDAWEPDGQGGVKLKEGVEFDEEHENQFNHELHAVIRKTQGNYDKFNRTGVEKEWWGRLGMFMRKWLVPMAVNRWGTKRYNNEEGDINEGFYRVFWNTLMKDLWNIRKNGIPKWDDYTASEKASIAKTLTEVGAVMLMFLLILGMGGYDDDPHFKDNGFLYNHILYQLIRLKSETETFQPISGINEAYRTVTTPTVAMTSVKQLLKLGALLAYGATGHDTTYQKDYGVWEEGDSKIWATLVSMIGYKGTTQKPDVLISNINTASRIK